jgi:ABC-type glycerol-3-phosphate transport system substrate-binding protein
MDVPLYYDSDANFLISKICQLEIPYASIGSDGKGHIDFETGAARTKTEELLTHIKGLYDDGVLRTKGTENKYGSDFFKNGLCLFTVGSSGGTGYSMPDGDAFKYNVCRVPSSSTNPENTNLYVSQGPTITFLKNGSLTQAENDRRMHYAWMFAKYITSTNVNADLALNHSEGYIPVRKSAFSTDLYNEWLENDDLVTKSADVLVNDIAGNYLNTKVFKGSAELREQVSGVIATICKQSISVTDALGSAINVAKTFM